MSVWAVSTVKNEADIIGATIAHLLAEGIEHILVYDGMSIDGTREVLAGFDRVTVFDDPNPIHKQPKLMTELARNAAGQGAEWIIPFDADEFWCTYNGDTIASALAALPSDVVKLNAFMFHHRDWAWRWPNHKPLGKMAFRWVPGVTIANGNHQVERNGVERADVLQVREIQYRSFEHFVEKIEARCATLDPSLPSTHGEHHKRLRHFPLKELEREWFVLNAQATTHDPIPSRCPPFAL